MDGNRLSADPSLQAVIDREAIRDLLVHFTFCLDSRQPERVADEVFDLEAEVDYGVRKWHGIDAIRRGFAESMSLFEGTAHVLGNHHIEIDSDHARSRAYVTAWHWTVGVGSGSARAADFVALVAYHDQLVRRPVGWRITSREVHQVGASRLAAGSVPPILRP